MTEPQIYPAEITPALQEVLGMMIFTTGPIAHAFRAAGEKIERRAEDEQAFVLHWLIGLALEHGDRWKGVASARLAELSVALEKARPG